jgi:MinD superfamily P-loop ATPase
MIGHNPRAPRVDADKCKACQRCPARKTCKLKALVQFESHELPYIDRELCRGCLACMEECPFRAIVME